MMMKVGATMGALIPVAAAAVANDRGATVATSVPLVAHFVGYPFEVGSMIAGICACLAVRFYVTQTDAERHRWTVDLPILALSLLFTAGAVIRLRPDPAVALVYGTGLGALGASIITICLTFIRSKVPGADQEKRP